MSDNKSKYEVKLLMPANNWFGLFEWPQWKTLQEEPVVAFAYIIVCDSIILEDYNFDWEEAERGDMARRIVVPMFKNYTWNTPGSVIEPYLDREGDLGKLLELYKGEGNHGFNKVELINKNFEG